MALSRREFLKASGATAGGLALYSVLGGNGAKAAPREIPLKKQFGEKTTVCPYCGVGCGVMMSVENGRLASIEGDADHPVSEGSLCPKGASLY